MWLLQAATGDSGQPSCSQGTYYLAAGTYFVGRDETSAHIMCLNDKAISRLHAEITVAERDATHRGAPHLVLKGMLLRQGTKKNLSPLEIMACPSTVC